MNGATHPSRTSKMVIAADLKERGFTYDQIGKALGICRDTAKNYANATTTGDARSYRGPEPRFRFCGLLAPCTCTGPMHAVDFLGRRGEPAPCASGLRANGGG